MRKWKNLIGWILVVALMGMTLGGCGLGDVTQAHTQIGPSEQFTRLQLNLAVARVKWAFAAEFPGCTLLEVAYEEQDFLARVERDGNNPDKTLVLTVSFQVGEQTPLTTLTPGQTYRGYQWVLPQGILGLWKIVNRGYA